MGRDHRSPQAPDGLAVARPGEQHGASDDAVTLRAGKAGASVPRLATSATGVLPPRSLSRIAREAGPRRPHAAGGSVRFAGLAPAVVYHPRASRAALEPDSGLSLWARARHLAYGLWLRRQRRITEARAAARRVRELRCARRSHVGWARTSRAACLERTSRQRVPESRDRLTAQDLQIAPMAAHGLTNREIGQRLFLSHRTIGSHL